MHNPLFGLRGLFLSRCPLPASSIQALHKPCSTRRMHFNSWSCAALDAIDLNHVSRMPVLGIPSSPNNHCVQQLHRTPPGVSLAPGQSNPSSGTKEAGTKRTMKDSVKSGRRRNVNSLSNERLRWYSVMLRRCSMNKSLREGKAIHGQVIKSGLDPDMHLWVSLVDVYAKCGSCQSARLVFDKMPEHDVVSWTALIAGSVAEGDGPGGVCLYFKMRKEGVRPNEFTFSIGLKACSLSLDSGFGKQVHSEVVKFGCLSDLFVGSALVDLYAKCGEMEMASSLFSSMDEKNAVSWNALLNGYAQIGDAEGVFNLFRRMKELTIKFSKVTLSTVVKGCANSASLREGRAVHSLAIRTGFELDEFFSCSLVDMYSKCGVAEDSLKVFRRINNPDFVTWTAIITCLDQQGHGEEAAKLFKIMRRAGITPNQYTFASLISAATNLSNLSYGQSIHACACKSGFESYTLISNALISMYMKMGSVQHGSRVFEATRNLDLISWNALLSGFHDEETCDMGPKIFSQLLLEGFAPNMYTYISVVRSCSSLLDLSVGKQVHGHIIKNSLDADTFVGTALVDMYAKCGSLEYADLIFSRLTERDVFSWTVIISGFAQSNRSEMAIRRFSQMHHEGVIPNEYTLASCLSSCASMTTIGNGQQLHSVAIKRGHINDVFVGASLVDMYAKCGCIEDSEAAFMGLASQDTVSWNTMLFGYSQHGESVKVLETFRRMLDSGIMPDEITFIGVLSACSHMGLIEQGREHFNSIDTIYGISPTLEHYACLIDILGRVGKLDEVESFIREMKVPPNAMIWQTVLGACKLHGNVDLGEMAAEKLFDLEPEVDSNYISLSNIYASKGRWNDVKRVRALMSRRGIKKEPGCSWLEVNGQVHVFLSQGCSHSMMQEIYLKLEDLREKLTSVGYIPKTEYVLQHVGEEEKKENLLYHSEKLALAFSLLSTNSRKPIRIFKNLRICGDCHDFMKLISDMTNRDIVVRDVSRFHHFKNGSCSCHDYW